MALDGLVVRGMVHELQKLTGGRIAKIHQPSGTDIVMQLRAQASNLKLLLSANPTYPRIHLTRQSFQNPQEAPMFCMLLRKHCEGGVIEEVRQVGTERIVHMDIRQRDELGDVYLKRIVVEIMGRHSNIILIDPRTGTILDGIQHVTPAISSHRIVLPGSSYTPPPEQGKADPLTVDRDAFREILGQAAEADESEGQLAKRLVGAFSGISPLAAAETVFRSRAERDRIGPLDALGNAFEGILSNIRDNRYFPEIREDAATGKSAFSVIELTHIQGERETFSSVSECLEAFYGDKAEKDAVKQRTGDLQRFLINERNKNGKKLEKLEETLEEAKDADKYRILGELLTASLHLLKKGDKEVEVVNYYDEEQKPVTIALDPLLTPSENSQRYFKKYTKTKNSLLAVEEQLVQTHEEIRYLDSLLQQLNSASLADIEEIREELVEQGYVRDRGRKQAKKKKKDKPALTRYVSSEGIDIYVGKNNIQNEYLTNRLSHASDTWLHTKDIPGSHVVIRSASYGEATLLEAASLAAYYSQAKESSQVPVDYTLIRHVRKPSGAKPGFVIYDHQKTLYVTPDEKLIKQMQNSPA
ncbi:NFACT RNA binding domain-containing protein [Paenibacillus aurantius]|uniref:Rqc2 homolog RqcH n=1 Tax=Paenibacillus aurantius TaxID=2918900 RepID=A0AA96LGJ4_9BACL|nr:NFACT RNA binding domain-containing protein [Paenibacillus aurantius]WNQ13659.1 NFACT RNA binding domain-containing protein [Paenibacillus aurantius]